MDTNKQQVTLNISIPLDCYESVVNAHVCFCKAFKSTISLNSFQSLLLANGLVSLALELQKIISLVKDKEETKTHENFAALMKDTFINEAKTLGNKDEDDDLSLVCNCTKCIQERLQAGRN